MKKVTVILPAFNEAKAIGKVIQEIRSLPIGCQVFVVDNLCTDNTPTIALDLGVLVIYEKKKGKGMAVRTGFKHASTPYIAMIDADGTYPVGSIPAFCEALSEYDVVKGNRKWCENGAMTKTHKFGNRMLSLLASILFGHRTRDVCSGMWAFRKECLDKFNLTSTGFTLEADLFINTVTTGCSLKELPIEYKKRIQGDKAKLMLRDGFEIGWFIIRRRLQRRIRNKTKGGCCNETTLLY